VLVVEDNLVNRTIVVRLLAKEGCEVDAADSGEEALIAVSRGSYDLILMDVNMPQVDGCETTQRIRGRKNPAAAYRLSR